jgi:hypothetical protein
MGVQTGSAGLRTDPACFDHRFDRDTRSNLAFSRRLAAAATEVQVERPVHSQTVAMLAGEARGRVLHGF